MIKVQSLLDLIEVPGTKTGLYERVEGVTRVGKELVSYTKVRGKTSVNERDPNSVRVTRSALRRALSNGTQLFSRRVINTARDWQDSQRFNKWFVAGEAPKTSAFNNATLVSIVRIEPMYQDIDTEDIGSLSYFFLHAFHMRRKVEASNSLFVLLLDLSTTDIVWRVYAQLRNLVTRVDGKVAVLGWCRETEKFICFNWDNISIEPVRRVIPTLAICRDTILNAPTDSRLPKEQLIKLSDIQSPTCALSEDELSTIQDTVLNKGKVEQLGLFSNASTDALVNLRFIIAQLIQDVGEGHDIGEDHDNEDFRSDESKSLLNQRAMRMVVDKVKTSLHSSNILAQLLFVGTVFFGRRSGETTLLNEAFEKGHAKSLLDKMAFDALSYAEGMLQVIENSCLHTSAGLSLAIITFHEIPRHLDGLPTTKQLAAVARKNMLEERYSVSKTRTHVPEGFQLELRVLDVSESEVAGSTRMPIFSHGIPRIFSRRNTFSVWRDVAPVENRRGVEWLFKALDNQMSPENAINHYGLCMLKKVVQTNHGIMRIVTPYDPTWLRDDRWHAESKKGLELYVMSEKTQGGIRETSYYRPGQALYSEVGILVPVCIPWRAMRSINDVLLADSEFYDLSYVGRDLREILLRVDYTRLHKGHMITVRSHREDDYADTYGYDAFVDTSKQQYVSDIKEKLVQSLMRERFSENQILVLDFMGEGLLETEVFSKALFGFLAERQASEDAQLLITIYFCQKSLTYHFLRMFSVFYAKVNDQAGRSPFDFAPFQIYVCTRSEEDRGDIPEINFVLSCTNARQAARTARAFCYRFAGATKDMLPFVEYLTSDIGKDGLDVVASREFDPIVPVDLYLRSRIEGNHLRQPHADERSWFYDHLWQLVNEEAIGGRPGCRYENVHLHVGSKIHIDDFFDCSGIFQNATLVKTMAYGLASMILAEGTHEGKPGMSQIYNAAKNSCVYLYGYEEIAGMLLREVAHVLTHCLKQSIGGPKIECIQYADGGDRVIGVNRLVHDCNVSVGGPCSPLVICIVPVGTTLSTLYKMRNTLYRKLSEAYELAFPGIRIGQSVRWNEDFEKGQLDIAKDYLRGLTSIPLSFSTAYVPILVAPTPESSEVRGYWQDVAIDNHLVEAARESSDRAPFVVHYLAKVHTRWSEPATCPICSGPSGRYLASADSVGAAPKVHVGSILGEGNLGVGQTGNVDELLLGAVDYGHIASGRNHIQCYVKPSEFFAKASASDKLSAWLKRLRKDIRTDTYNIIIAPMEGHGSEFYSAVIETAFEHCLRFIHVDLLGSTVDEIRLRYRSVIDDVRKVGGHHNVSFYFLQNVISSGATMRKAQSVVRMIRQEAGLYLDMQEPEFELCIALIDKTPAFTVQKASDGSSRGTIRAFRTLAIPAHGVRASSCPVCESVEGLKKLSNDCSATDLAVDFSLLANRREVVSHRSYTTRLLERRQKDESCLVWLLEWYDYAVSDYANLSELKLMGTESLYYATPTDLCSLVEEVWNNREDKDAPITINDIDAHDHTIANHGPEQESFWGSLLDTKVIALHNYMRLACGHELNVSVTQAMERETTTGPMDDAQIVLGCLVQAIDGRLIASMNPYMAKEWLIAYLKVAARGILSQTLAMRRALLVVCTYLADCYCFGLGHGRKLLQDWNLDEKTRDGLERVVAYVQPTDDCSTAPFAHFGNNASFRLHLLRTVVNRLAELHSPYLLEAENIVAIYNALQDASSSIVYGSEARQTIARRNVQEGWLHRFMRRTIKECALTGEDDTRTLRALALADELDHRDAPATPWLWLSNSIRIEATEIIRKGIQRLWEVWCTVPVRETLITLSSDNERLEPSIGHVSVKYDAILEVYNNDVLFDAHVNAARAVSLFELNQYYVYEQCAEELVKLILEHSTLEGKMLLQSPFRRFFEFMTVGFPESATLDSNLSNENVKRISRMLLLMKYVRELQGRAMSDPTSSDRPSSYEGICNCIRDLLDALECRLVQVSNGVATALSGSSFLPKHLELEFSPAKENKEGRPREESRSDDESRRLLRSISGERLREEFPQMHLDGVVAVRQNLMAIALSCEDIDDGHTGLSDGLYIAALYEDKNHAKVASSDIERLRNVLFMRGELANVALRDLSLLHEDITDYACVRKVSDCASGMRALHISDLHISTKSHEYRKLDDYLWDGGNGVLLDDQNLYDLVLVTGDVVQGSKTPKEFSDNYAQAAWFLVCLAHRIWADAEGRLRRDWRKRIAIVTGNHDYASMNDYEAMHTERKRANDLGRASRERGTAMSQFLYLSRFLHDTLGENISSLWSGGLNDVRNYDRLGVSLVMLNTSARVSAMRTNKVGVVEGIVPRELACRVTDGNDVILMGHHSPSYDINYVADEFYDCSMGKNGTMWGRLYELEKVMEDYAAGTQPVPEMSSIVDRSIPQDELCEQWVQDSLYRWLKNFASMRSDYKELPAPMGGINALDVWVDPSESCLAEFKRSPLVRGVLDARRLSEHDGHGFGVESLISIERSIEMNKLMSQRDTDEFRHFFGELMRGLRCLNDNRSVISISGHTHIGSSGLLDSDRNVPCMTIGRMLDLVFVADKDKVSSDAFNALAPDLMFAGYAVRRMEKPTFVRRYALRFAEVICRSGSDGFDYNAHALLFDPDGGGIDKAEKYNLELGGDLPYDTDAAAAPGAASVPLDEPNRYVTEVWKRA